MSDNKSKASELQERLASILDFARKLPREDAAADLDDAELRDFIESVVAPYFGFLTPTALDEARDALALVFTAHPGAMAAFDRQRVRPIPDSSGVVQKRTAGALAQAAEGLRRVGDKGVR
jgi:hypothetical protein